MQSLTQSLRGASVRQAGLEISRRVRRTCRAAESPYRHLPAGRPKTSRLKPKPINSSMRRSIRRHAEHREIGEPTAAGRPPGFLRLANAFPVIDAHPTPAHARVLIDRHPAVAVFGDALPAPARRCAEQYRRAAGSAPASDTTRSARSRRTHRGTRRLRRSRSAASPTRARASPSSGVETSTPWFAISSTFHPAPMPSTTRPPDSRSSEATCFAMRIGSRSVTGRCRSRA